MSAAAWQSSAEGPQSDLGAADQELQKILRTARAEVARLALELRSVLREVDHAEGQAREMAPVDEEDDFSGARQRQHETLRQWIETRRQELARELAAAERQAAEIVAHSHREALELTVEAANDARQRLVDAGILAPDSPPRPEAQESTTAFRLVDPVDLRIPPHPGAEPPEPPVGTPVRKAETVAAVSEHAVPFPSEVVDGGAPEAEPHSRDESDVVVVAADDWAPAADEWAPPAPESVVVPSAPRVRRRATVDAPEQSEAVRATEHRTWTSFVYLDVLLPLIAVVIVVVVLLAWIG